jgi:hypothetical protein
LGKEGGAPCRSCRNNTESRRRFLLMLQIVRRRYDLFAVLFLFVIWCPSSLDTVDLWSRRRFLLMLQIVRRRNLLRKNPCE